MKKRPAYTLLELLVSVAIFAGIIILALGAFARSATSASKTATLQDKVQAARSVLSQISSDLHYVDTQDQVASLANCDGTSPSFIGVRLGTAAGCDEIELLLRYPDASGNTTLVWKRYVAQTLNGRPSLYSYEARDCAVNGSVLACTTGVITDSHDLLSGQYVLDGLSGLNKVFTGSDYLGAQQAGVSPYIKIHFDLKPKSLQNLSCSSLSGGSCYTLDTTVVPKGI